ncbi:MAG: 50S ribosomal protein L4 [Verrucomicrobia bacterium]|nr:50S ribosomal protein L4 [Verrucomicrobiota bacterium]
MKLKVFSVDGSSAGEKDYALPEFEGTRGIQALKQVILALQANQRQGNASTKTRAEVAGTKKKPFKQKGLGIARQGTRRGPQHYKGGVAFGPKPRDYSQAINKKMRSLALARVLFDRASAGEVSVIEKWEVADKKTKLFNSLIGKVAPQGSVLVVDADWADSTVLAARNIERIDLNEASDVNALDVARYDTIVVSEKGIETILNRLNGGN